MSIFNSLSNKIMGNKSYDDDDIFDTKSNKNISSFSGLNKQNLEDAVTSSLRAAGLTSQNESGSISSASKLALQLKERSDDKKSQRTIAEKDADARREINMRRELGTSSFSTDTTKRDIFGRNIGDSITRDEGNRYKTEQDARNFSYDTQSSERDAANQRKLTEMENRSKEKIAGIQSQGSVLSSVFGSVNNGTPNFRYWTNRGE